MTALFTKAQHWQIFLVIFVLPRLLPLILILSNENGFIIQVQNFSIHLGILAGTYYLGWLWVIGTKLHRLVIHGIKGSSLIFKASFVSFALLVVIYLLLIRIYFGPDSLTLEFLSFAILSTFGIMLLPLFIVIVPWLLCSAFIARQLALIRFQRSVELQDYLGDLVLLLIFPIGIWKIQPEINRLVQD